MQIPQSYTTPELAEYMERVIGPLAGILELSAAYHSFTDAAYDALLGYGVSDAEDADDIPRLRAYAEREAWRLVRDTTVGYYDLRSPDGATYNRSQIHEHAVRMYQEADSRVAEFEGVHAVRRTTLRRVPDPYRRVEL